MLSASCEGCHGTNGNSPGSIPSISGRSADYIMKALVSFETGEREATVMQRHARGYTAEELQLIAEQLAQASNVKE
jgi:sulfide dehydrogenase cytochrome subunit